MGRQAELTKTKKSATGAATGRWKLEDAKARFENTIYPGVGHVYLPEMWEKTLKWMDRWVKRP